MEKFSLAVFIVVLTAGCVQPTGPTPPAGDTRTQVNYSNFTGPDIVAIGAGCIPPYILDGPQCCADRDGNFVCDREENEKTGRSIEIVSFGREKNIIVVKNTGNRTISGGSLSVSVNNTPVLCGWDPKSFDTGSTSVCNLSIPCP